MRKNQSSDIGRFGRLTVDIDVGDDSVSFLRSWGRGGYKHEDALSIVLDGEARFETITDAVVPECAMMNVRRRVGESLVRTARLLEPAESATEQSASYGLEVREHVPVRTSQGDRSLVVYHEIRLNAERDVLTWEVKRESRRSSLSYVLKKRGVKEAYVMNLIDDWEVRGGLDGNALLLSLQGNVNRDAPLLYFVYPEGWDFRFTPSVLEFLRDRRGYSFSQLAEPWDAVERFRDYLDGYVVWDPEVRTSLIVAFTVAGVRNLLVVSPRQIAEAAALGLVCLEDLRGRFRGLSDYDIYRVAKDAYFDSCSNTSVVWMGGEHGDKMKPGVADWGIANRMFFTDLSTSPDQPDERALAGSILESLEPNALVFGWHSYAKDTEEQHVTLCSSFGHRVEGLHSLPNMSFTCHVQTSPGFTFRNNHSVAPDEHCRPERKIYIACVQTDCLGIGAWTRPGRGEIPYAWEVTMNWVWLAPAMMEFFYTQATPNDYFIGALSGPGYMYPKAVPPDKLPPILERANDLMATLDLRIFEIMDYSEGFFHIGTVDLPERILRAYYDRMPQAVGFLNGYGPAGTFFVRDGRPTISFDYYVHPTTPEDHVTADIEELAVLNPSRPYFLLLHVRNFADIRRVVRILERLGDEFEVVPLDRFARMAALEPTFRNQTLEE